MEVHDGSKWLKCSTADLPCENRLEWVAEPRGKFQYQPAYMTGFEVLEDNNDEHYFRLRHSMAETPAISWRDILDDRYYYNVVCRHWGCTPGRNYFYVTCSITRRSLKQMCDS